MRKKILVAAAVIAAALLAGLSFAFFAPKAQPAEKTVTVQVVAEKEGVNKSFTYRTERAFMADLLEDEKKDLKPEMENGPYGKFVAGLLGIRADPKKEYYNIKVDGKDAVQGISELPLKDKSKITFTLTPL